ncbi:UNVERIFIED_CONTAM: hypothetical protein NCL1_60040 [Trichonephila clavipes]
MDRRNGPAARHAHPHGYRRRPARSRHHPGQGSDHSLPDPSPLGFQLRGRQGAGLSAREGLRWFLVRMGQPARYTCRTLTPSTISCTRHGDACADSEPSRKHDETTSLHSQSVPAASSPAVAPDRLRCRMPYRLAEEPADLVVRQAVPGRHERSAGGRPACLRTLQRLLHPCAERRRPSTGRDGGRDPLPGRRRDQPAGCHRAWPHLPGQGPQFQRGGTARRRHRACRTLHGRSVRDRLPLAEGLPPRPYAAGRHAEGNGLRTGAPVLGEPDHGRERAGTVCPQRTRGLPVRHRARPDGRGAGRRDDRRQRRDRLGRPGHPAQARAEEHPLRCRIPRPDRTGQGRGNGPFQAGLHRHRAVRPGADEVGRRAERRQRSAHGAGAGPCPGLKSARTEPACRPFGHKTVGCRGRPSLRTAASAARCC